jgi:hypothetical protein
VGIVHCSGQKGGEKEWKKGRGGVEGLCVAKRALVYLRLKAPVAVDTRARDTMVPSPRPQRELRGISC